MQLRRRRRRRRRIFGKGIKGSKVSEKSWDGFSKHLTSFGRKDDNWSNDISPIDNSSTVFLSLVFVLLVVVVGGGGGDESVVVLIVVVLVLMLVVVKYLLLF